MLGRPKTKNLKKSSVDLGFGEIAYTAAPIEFLHPLKQLGDDVVLKN